MQPALMGVVGHGGGQLVGGHRGEGLQAGAEQQLVELVMNQSVVERFDFLVGAHGGDHHGGVLGVAHTLVGGLAVEDGQGAHQLNGRGHILGGQRAGGRVEQLVHTAGMQLGAQGVGHGRNGVDQHGIIA